MTVYILSLFREEENGAYAYQLYDYRIENVDINSEMGCKNCFGKCVTWFWIWASSHYSGKGNFRAIKKRELYLIHPRGPRKAHTN
ncbi:MAG: hypothetical protein WCJ61_13790 [Paludibacter sp.]